MTSWIAAALLVVAVVVLLRAFGLVRKSGEVVAIAHRSLRVIRDPGKSDEAKEAELQDGAKRLFRLFFVLAFGGSAAVLPPTGALWLCDRLGWLSLESVFLVAVSPRFLILSGALALLVLCFRPSRTSEKSGYSALDRWVHRVAFRTYGAQAALADLEDRLFARQLAACELERPVFITALPRAGTTLLLECCARLPDFASHSYRDMPFLLIPCLWSRLSGAFQRAGEPRERAHGDGMLIDFDSFEAMEEVLWTTFWPRHYRADRIVPWHDEDDAEFAEFFSRHMRKVVLVRGGEGPRATRYVSKNNVNVARVAMLRRLFPDCVIVVPFREPLQHAASLLEQHRRFLRIHEEDPFACEYMRAIGHYDFGKNLRPVDFQSWLDGRESRDAQSLPFWLEYWVAAYRHVMAQRDDLLLVSYEALCQAPETGLHRLAEAIGTTGGVALSSAAAEIRSPRAREIDTESIPSSLVREAHSIYDRLNEAALKQAHPVRRKPGFEDAIGKASASRAA